MKKYISIVLSLFISLIFSQTSATVRYVTQTGAGSLTGSSWSNAANDLQLTINNSSSGDTIWVAAGTYKPNRPADNLNTIDQNNRKNAFVLKSGVKIYGGFAGSETSLNQRNITNNICILSGDLGTVGTVTDNAYHVVISAASAGSGSNIARLDGFTITGGYANTYYPNSNVNNITINSTQGGGIYCSASSPNLVSLKVDSNYALVYGGGIYLETSSSPYLSGVTVSNNSVANGGGGGIYASASNSVISYCNIKNNTATRLGGGAYFTSTSKPNIQNTTFDTNTASQSGGGIYIDGTAVGLLLNCIISNNTASSQSGGGIYNAYKLTTYNTLIYKNTAGQGGGGVYSTNSNTTTLVNNTIAYNNSLATYTVGAGVNGTITLSNSIIWGNLRGGSVSDNVTGSITYNYCLLESGVVSGPGIISNKVPRFKDVANDNYRLNGYSPAVNVGSNSLNTATVFDLDGNNRIYDNGTIDLGAYEYQSNNTAAPTKTKTLYVKKGGAGTQDGSSWANAVGELSEALKLSDESGEVMQIWVAAGTYMPGYYAGDGTSNGEKSFVLQKDVKVYGGFAGTETSLSQRNWKNNLTILSGNSTNYHVVISADDAGTAVLDGFNITGSKSSGSGETTTVNSQTIQWKFGGAIYCNLSSPQLSNLKIYSNSSTLAAAIYCENGSNPNIYNSLIYKNNSSQIGAGIYADNSSNPTITNSSIVYNAAGSWTDGAGVYGNMTINNSIIWGNTGNSNASGNINYNYCLLQGGSLRGTAIISNSDPLFTNSSTNDYTLKSNSPARNIGNNNYVTSISTDLACYPRISNGTVDLGAYEYTTVNQWTGAVSTDSENAANWSLGSVLADNDYLEFSTTAQNNLILNANHKVQAIMNNSSKSLILNGYKLSVTGLITVGNNAKIDATATNSTVEFAGTAAQSIPAGAFLNDSFYNLNINNSSNVTAEQDFTILNNTTSSNGVLDAISNEVTVKFAGTTTQSINSDVFKNNQLYNMLVDNAQGVSIATNVTILDSLIINSGKKIIIPVTMQLTTNGPIVNHAGASGIVIKSSPYEATGTFFFSGAAPQATVEFYSKAQNFSGAKRWQYFTVPVTSASASPIFTGATIRQWNEAGSSSANPSWTPLSNTSSLTAGIGYEIYQATPTTYSISGTLTKDDINRTLTYTTGSYYPGYHIVGNPYTASIDLSQLESSGIGNNLEATIWLYNTGSSAEWKNNSVSSTDFTGNPGQYTAVPLNLAGRSGVEQYIPSMQGFLVKTVDATPGPGTLSIPFSTTQKNSTMQRTKAAVTQIPCTMASIYSGDTEVDRLWLFTEANCTKNFDNGWDGRKMLSSKTAQIYAIGDDDVYQMSTNADIDNTVIGLTPIAGTSTYTIKFRHNDEDSQQYQKMYFTDLSNGQTFDVTNNNTDITITTDNSTTERKFLLTLQRITTFVDNNTADSGVKITSADKQIVINNATDESVNAYIYDIAGRLIGQEKVDAEATVSYSKNIVDQNIVIVKVVSNNVNLSKKLIIE